ncbi:MAG: hypothetical protein AABW54_02345, partial [Candidatus Micrarchaeota archaeon]
MQNLALQPRRPAWLEEFAKSSYQLWQGHDPQSHLPFNAFGLYSYYERLWIEKMLAAVMRLKEVGRFTADIALPNASACRFSFLLTIMHLQNARMTDKRAIKALCNFFRQAIAARMQGEDEFAFSANFTHAPSSVQALLQETAWETAGVEEARLLGKLVVGLATLVHGLYNDWFTDYSYEVSGPYAAAGKHLMLVREFDDLKPVEVWLEAQAFRHKRVSILAEYEGLECKIAFVGCHATFSRSLVDGLVRYAVFADGKQVTGRRALAELAEYFLKTAQEHYANYAAMGIEAQKEKYFLQEAYVFKWLFDAAG